MAPENQAQPTGGEPVDNVNLSPEETAPLQDKPPAESAVLPEKLRGKSTQEIADMYQEAERKMHREAQSRAQTERRLAQLEAQTASMNSSQQEDYNRRLKEFKENDPAGYADWMVEQKLTALRQETAQQGLVQQAVGSYFVENKEMNTKIRRQLMAQCTAEVQQANPHLDIYDILKEADTMAREIIKEEVDKELTTRAKKEASLKSVQTESANERPGSTKQDDEDEPTREDYFAERRAGYRKAFQR